MISENSLLISFQIVLGCDFNTSIWFQLVLECDSTYSGTNWNKRSSFHSLFICLCVLKKSVYRENLHVFHCPIKISILFSLRWASINMSPIRMIKEQFSASAENALHGQMSTAFLADLRVRHSAIQRHACIKCQMTLYSPWSSLNRTE